MHIIYELYSRVVRVQALLDVLLASSSYAYWWGFHKNFLILFWISTTSHIHGEKVTSG